MRFFVLFLCLLPALAQADTWTPDYNRSSIAVSAGVYDAPFGAVFEDFELAIEFDPTDLSNSSVKATIATDSFTAQNSEDSLYAFEATGADWFSSSQFPEATFTSTNFAVLDVQKYRVDGLLSLKNQDIPLSFDFGLNIVDDEAIMRAEVPLNRETLGLGLLTHPNDTTVQYEVMLILDVVATR